MAACSPRWAVPLIIAALMSLALLSAPAAVEARPRPSIGVSTWPCREKTSVSRCAAELEGTRLSRSEAACLIGTVGTVFGGVVGGIIGGSTARAIAGAIVGGSAGQCLDKLLDPPAA